jgi:uncharacterized protein
MLEDLPCLGVGIGFRPAIRSEIFLNRANIDFLEITADHYLDVSSQKLDELELLLDHFALVPHSLDLSLGSAEGVDERYLEKLALLIERVKPPWFSDHICFTRSGGTNIGHLAPVPFTEEVLAVFERNIQRVISMVNAPLILENISYSLSYPSSEMDEAEFIGRLLERTGCGMLLDITNLAVNGANLGYDPGEYLSRLPLHRVVQLHFVGVHHHHGRTYDMHADATGEEVWKLMEEVANSCNVKGAVLERDENFPEFVELSAELARARSILH